VSTVWAYERMAAGAPQSYLPAGEAERRIAAWIEGNADAAELLFNNLEPVVFRKFLALPALLDRLGRQFGLAPRMSGSGSACFALLPSGAPVPEMVRGSAKPGGRLASFRRPRSPIEATPQTIRRLEAISDARLADI